MRQRLLLAAALLAPVVVVAFVLEGLVRTIIVEPLLYLLWGLNLIVASLPQVLVWGLLVLLVVSLFWRTLLDRPSIPQVRRDEPPPSGRLEDLARLVSLSRHDNLARWRLAQRLGQLTTETLAAEERVPPREIWRRIERGGLDMPAPMQAYLRSRLRVPSHWQRLSGRSRAMPLAFDPREVVEFLEDRERQTSPQRHGGDQEETRRQGDKETG